MKKTRSPLSSNSASRHIAVYGGTFCPIHRGHIEVALFLQDLFKFDQFNFLPNKAPVLDKTAEVSLEHRLAMLQLALTPYPFFNIDRREIDRLTPSFMVETLSTLREELVDKSTAITLIIGMDSFLQFHRWREFEKILTLCNLIVLERPGWKSEIPEPLQGKINEIIAPYELSTGKTGGFYLCDAGKYDISSTKIREAIKAGADMRLFLTPEITDYIKKHKLFGYQSTSAPRN